MKPDSASSMPARSSRQTRAAGEVAHIFGAILATYSAITQNPKDVGQEVPVVSMAARLIQDAPGRGR